MNWPVILPVGLGLLSVFLLLPRPRGYSRVLGYLSTLAALVALIAFLVGGLGTRPVLSVETILFYTFAPLAFVFAVLMISQRRPARSALCFAAVVLNTCGLFLLLAAPFLMAATLIVYAGAIVVTFLFVIMLSQQSEGGHNNANDRSREPLLASIAGFVMLGVLLVVLQRAYVPNDAQQLLAKAEEAAKAENVESIRTIIGTESEFFDRLSRGLERYRPLDDSATLRDPYRGAILAAMREFDATIENTQFALNAAQPNLTIIQRGFAELAQKGGDVLGMVNDPAVAASTITLSHYSGAYVPGDGKRLVPADQLPAANVSAIGRSLFSDHLLAVELAGSLLLVATIGAILIAGVRGEKHA